MRFFTEKQLTIEDFQERMIIRNFQGRRVVYREFSEEPFNLGNFPGNLLTIVNYQLNKNPLNYGIMKDVFLSLRSGYFSKKS